MAAIQNVRGTAIAVRGNDIDTDRIIPARFLKAVTFDGIGERAFEDARLNPDRTPTDHPFNRPGAREASVLLVNQNFGCGSSREHAPQALLRWGIRAIVGESFAEIFAGNCTAIGVPAVTAAAPVVEALMRTVEADPSAEVLVDLELMVVKAAGREHPCSMNEGYRRSLVSGSWDSTGELLANRELIERTAAGLPYLAGFSR